MPNIVKELAVIVGSYQDRKTGQTKNRYKNVGVLMEGEQNGERYSFLLLDRSFNPAGVPFKDGGDKIVINMFEPRDRDGNNGARQTADSANSFGAGGGYGGGMEDDIPFFMEWRV